MTKPVTIDGAVGIVAGASGARCLGSVSAARASLAAARWEWRRLRTAAAPPAAASCGKGAALPPGPAQGSALTAATSISRPASPSSATPAGPSPNSQLPSPPATNDWRPWALQPRAACCQGSSSNAASAEYCCEVLHCGLSAMGPTASGEAQGHEGASSCSARPASALPLVRKSKGNAKLEDWWHTSPRPTARVRVAPAGITPKDKGLCRDKHGGYWLGPKT
mmetsp:Transcript_15098/g.34255  ORF Transcript_15098/g.34255 Transcript_15098/m.34255 type:complete len:222 (+) Transcript_15098:511-1176(+)